MAVRHCSRSAGAMTAHGFHHDEQFIAENVCVIIGPQSVAVEYGHQRYGISVRRPMIAGALVHQGLRYDLCHVAYISPAAVVYHVCPL